MSLTSNTVVGPTCATFLWLVFHQRILTKDVLSNKGWTGDLTCPLCQNQPETTCHLFLHCNTTVQLWNWIPTIDEHPCPTTSLHDLWQGTLQLHSQQMNRGIELLGALL
jgi:zinc-binding in reverse transcriptase